jgi:hypothetical protein
VGATYTFHLCFPAACAPAVLRAAAAMADPVGESRVRLPDGSSLAVPFTVRLNSGEVALGAEPWTTFDASLWLPVDEAVRAFVEGDEASDASLRRTRRAGEGGPEVAIGYVYLTVGVGRRYALLSFSAPTTDMSLLFQNSAAIRGRFDRLLMENGGLLGLFDQEWAHFPLLPDFTRHVVLDEERIRRADADGWVEAALAAEVRTC